MYLRMPNKNKEILLSNPLYKRKDMLILRKDSDIIVLLGDFMLSIKSRKEIKLWILSLLLFIATFLRYIFNQFTEVKDVFHHLMFLFYIMVFLLGYIFFRSERKALKFS